MFGYWLRERARERGRERERQQKERKRERETVSTPLPSTSSGIIRGTSPIQAGAARAVLGPQTPVQEAPGTLQPSSETSASGPTREDLAPRPHEPAEGESDPTRAHAAPNAAVNVTTEEEHTNEPYDMIGNDNPPNQGLRPNFDVFDDFFEDSSEDVAKFAAEAEDVPQTSPANPVLPVPEPTGEPPTLSMRQRERLLQLYQNGVVSRETPKETDASVWRRYREQCKKEHRDHRRDHRRLHDWQPDLKRRRKGEQ